MTHRIATTLAAITAALAIGAAPAAADGPAAQTEHLDRHEAAKTVKRLLRYYIGPVISSEIDPDPRGLTVRAWDCSVERNKGTCQGSVVGGTVTCRGVFRVFEYPRKYVAYPDEMNCTRD